MKVLMFGWEFPPFKSGGLGTACYDLTKGLSAIGTNVTFVMPHASDKEQAEFVKLVGTSNLSKNIKIKSVNTVLTPYMTADQYHDKIQSLNGTSNSKEVYGKNLYEEVERFSLIAPHVAKEQDHDLIHVHDWMTYKAGILAREKTGKPLVAHIHATEFDRTGGNPNPFISHREYEGLNAADIVIANSNYTKDNVIQAYDIDPEKIKVVHWGIDPENPHYDLNYSSALSDADKLVLFLGRITIQKGPEYFIEAAKKVTEHVDNVKFVVAGGGDMLPAMIDKANELGIGDKVIFRGWLKGADVHKAFQMADLYVMPSVSEPFGLVALESMKNNTPILISKQSGASEVIKNALKTNFWDVDEMANKIVNTLKYDSLYQDLKENSYKEAQKFNLIEPARKTLDIYHEAVGGLKNG